VSGSQNDGLLAAVEAELQTTRQALAEQALRADQAAEELRAVQSSLGWRALSAYRRAARRVAPGGSRRGQAYDAAVATARGSIQRLRRASTPHGNGHVAPLSAPAPAEPALEGPFTDVPAGPPGQEVDTWFRDHYDYAADEVIGFLAEEGISLSGKLVADIGAGDGIIDLGLARKGTPARLVGFDVNPVDRDKLLSFARRESVCDHLPETLEFCVSGPTGLPAEDASFDVLVTWSAFEHIPDPLGVLREMRRVIRDDGIMFLQVWPFYYSQFGSHLRDWFPDGWDHLTHTPAEIETTLRSSGRHDPGWDDVMLAEFAELNKVTVDELGAAMLEAGFLVKRLQLLTRRVSIPPGPAAQWPLTALGVEGVEFLAVPRRTQAGPG
jgi:2-polyprenyl-3-methyl-5-hydroxy-6-metoxy-1,4-benzoquinol methylase